MGKKSGGVRIKQVGGGGNAGNAKMPLINPMEEFMMPPDGNSEMLNNLPVPLMNRKYQVFWPIHESFTMTTTDFQVVYPNYLDSTKTVKQGRRLAAAAAVPRPTVSDLSQALQQLRLRHVIQPYKGYSPDPNCVWDNPGRCLVDVSNHKKKELLALLAGRIPALSERKVRLERQAAAELEQQRVKEEEERAAATAAAAETAKSSNNHNPQHKKTVAVSSNKKKIKGKRK